MSDDLVKRLRLANAYKGPDFSTPFVEPVKQEAADRIEELEAKLAKATECIEGWLSLGCPHCSGDCSGANPPVSACIMQMTRTTLAELKGYKG